TPVKIASLCVVVNLVLNLAVIALALTLMIPFAHVGIALATAIAAWLNAALLARGLRRRGFLVLDRRLKRRLPRVVIASILMAAGLLAGTLALAGPLAGDEAARIGTLVVLISGGLVLFVLLAQFTGAVDLRELKGMMGRSVG
ncbi:MAG: lipid II flippase MurJ, partial [Alphaproteobacteria bacterium]